MLNNTGRIIKALICAAVSASALCSCTAVQNSGEISETSEIHTAESTSVSETTAITTDPAVTSDTAPEQNISTGQTSPEETSAFSESAVMSIEEPPAVQKEPVTLDAAAISGYSVGRTLLSDDVLYMNHSCSGFRFDFRGTSLKAEFVSSAEYCYDEIHRAWIAVYLGDSTEPYRRFPLDREQGEYTLFESDQPTEARITVVKLTEEQFGTAGIKSLELGAADVISRVPDSGRYIEFFGDSITAGYGNEGELSHGFDTSEENGYLTYAPITARALGADYSMVCVSGMGLTDSRTCSFVAGDIYSKTDAFISDQEYGFERQPQLIVVNLGANDSYYINKDSSYYDLYESRYYDLLAEIRSKNPDAVIFCCICDYWKARMPQIERVIEKYTADTGDSKIHSLLLPYVTRDEDYGSDAHPKIKVQYEISEVLIDKIEQLGIF